MIIDKLTDMNGCIKDGKVCRYCLGNIDTFPAHICCSIGNECGRGSCCFHKTDEQLRKELNN